MNQTCSLCLDSLYKRNRSTQGNKLISNGEQSKEVSLGDETAGIYLEARKLMGEGLQVKDVLDGQPRTSYEGCREWLPVSPGNPASSEGGSTVPTCFSPPSTSTLPSLPHM